MRDERPDASDAAAAEVAAELTGPSDAMTLDEVRRRAAAGAATLGLRSLIVYAFGLVGNLVLAGLLVPSDFGLVALGTTLLILGSFLANGGLGAALIGRRSAPDRAELEAVLGMQLAVTVAFALLFTAAAWPFGRDGLVPALMLFALPLATLRVPASIMFERELSYRAIATVDVVEGIAQYVWAIAAVAAGLGVWGLASAALVRTALGTATMMRLSPLGFVRPRWSWGRVRPTLGFGLRFQGVSLVGVGRDQGLNIGIAAVGGIGSLGLWSLGFRIMQVPLLLFGNLYRVSYPAMARLIAAGESVRNVLERSVGVVAAGTAVLVVGIAAGAPGLVVPLLGHRWADLPDIVLWSSVGLMIGAPVTATSVGYLLAVGDAGIVLRAALANTVAWLGIALGLLPVIGVASIGLGWVAAALIDVSIVGRRASRTTGARILPALLPPLAIAMAAGGAGYAISSSGSPSIAAGVVGALTAEALLIAGLLTLRPRIVRDATRLAGRSLREAAAG